MINIKNQSMINFKEKEIKDFVNKMKIGKFGTTTLMHVM